MGFSYAPAKRSSVCIFLEFDLSCSISRACLAVFCLSWLFLCDREKNQMRKRKHKEKMKIKIDNENGGNNQKQKQGGDEDDN